MAGTMEGGKRAANTNKTRYGNDFYNTIGAMGGRKSTGGGFAKDPELAKVAGRLGGLRSRRKPSATGVCSFDGCDGIYYGAPYCATHKSQLKRTGRMFPIKHHKSAAMIAHEAAMIAQSAAIEGPFKPKRPWDRWFRKS